MAGGGIYTYNMQLLIIGIIANSTPSDLRLRGPMIGAVEIVLYFATGLRRDTWGCQPHCSGWGGGLTAIYAGGVSGCFSTTPFVGHTSFLTVEE